MAMFSIHRNEGTAEQRRIPVYFSFIYNSLIPATGVVNPTILISKNGNAYAAGAGTFAEIGSGNYYYEFAQSEVNTNGWVQGFFGQANLRDYNCVVDIISYDKFDDVRLGLSGLPNAIAGTVNGILTDNANTDSVLNRNFPSIYYADVNYVKDDTNTRDEYTITWFKNNQILATGVVNTYLNVYKRTDGTNLITNQACSQIGSIAAFKYDATGAERQSIGEAIYVLVSGHIDGNPRQWGGLYGRDN